MLPATVQEQDLTGPRADPVLGYILGESTSFDHRAYREKIARQAALVIAYATADPVLMFSPSIHDVALKPPGEYEGDYRERPKYARTLTSRVLDARVQGCAALPMTYTPSTEGVDLSGVLRRMSVSQIQTLTECTGTVAARPVYDPSTDSVFYQTYGAHEIVPYLGPGDNQLVGISLERGEEREIWTPYTWALQRKGETLKTGPNPYGEIPVAIMRTRRHPRLWWGVADLAVVTLNNIAVNKLWTDLIQLATEQSFAIYVVYEDDAGDSPAEHTDAVGDQPARRADLAWTSGKTVFVPKGGKIETISPDADIKAIGETVETMGSRALDDAYLIDIAQSQAGQSGFSLRVRMQPYLNKMRSVRGEFLPGIEDLIGLGLLVEYVGRTGIAATRRPDFRVRITVDDSPLTPVPTDEVVRRYEFEQSIGASSSVDYVAETRGIPRVEAEARVDNVRKDTEAGRNGAGPKTSPPTPPEPSTDGSASKTKAPDNGESKA